MSAFAFFLLFVKVSALTFGGGYAMVSLFQFELVTRNALLTAEQFANLVAIAQVTPGPIGFNAATFAGMVHGGLEGSLAASFGMMVPSLTITLAVAAFLAQLGKSSMMKDVMRGIRPCVLGIIAAAVVFFADTSVFTVPLRESLRGGEFGMCWQGAAIFLVILVIRARWQKVSPVWLLVASAALGWLLF